MFEAEHDGLHRDPSLAEDASRIEQDQAGQES
jgi:hypothetical protein